MPSETLKRDGIWALSREERWELAQSLVRRGDASADAEAALRRAYPTAPDAMIDTATFHVYVEGPDAVLAWLADAELFLRDPDHRLCGGVTWHLLHHVYNWQQFQALLPAGKPGVLELIREFRKLADEGALKAAQETARQLEELFAGNVDTPNIEIP